MVTIFFYISSHILNWYENISHCDTKLELGVGAVHPQIKKNLFLSPIFLFIYIVLSA